MAATQGLKFLESKGIPVTLHPYDYDPNAEAVGLAAAAALGIDPALMLKTLMVEVDGKPVCCVIPSDRQLSMKKVAEAFGGKSAAMMAVAAAEKLTGYKVGGISPFGPKRAVPVAIEVSACSAERVWINAGQRGLLLGIAPAQAKAALAAQAVALIA
ncbi:Cys-tRNA(Pro)/Cys-tRNA(Cys) deacylase [Cypionkella aquatica]|uniref:Cys-tRNA(Pro)/Cys-tRNA(Cys) deacylase n=1 Tax=Cypionkella aquatica TaxID=1756042 RepID=A0AA37U7G0_9RHOB|nr:YbaK/EbsC family protein [Cypionkella aquatica]GLS88704.1 Cys-tRNA(Pro)/Cys-tRNA(Cys) deacylase [Cypionkella aquatica]